MRDLLRISSLVVFVVHAAACAFPRPADVEPDGTPGTSTYQLNAIEPSTAATGDTISLEGTFASTVTVNFPGGASQNATVLGDHRAAVIVPSTATIGPLSVTTGGATIGALPFRRATFALGLQSFQGFYDQASAAQQTPTLATARSGHVSVAVGSYLYVLGGLGSSGVLRSIERARINADGSLGPFTVADVSLATARAGHTCAILGIFLYVLGGSDSAGVLGSVERATINADGSLGPFATIPGVMLATPRKAATTEIIGSSLYIIGGTGSGVLSAVERATINPDGSLGAFATVPGVSLASARTGHTSAIVGDSLYVLGGSGSSGVLDSVEQAMIGGDGSLGAFATVTQIGLKTARASHTSVVVGNALYVLGGVGSTGAATSVEQATIHDVGSLGPFAVVTATALATARSGQATALVGNFLYLVGGSGAGGGTLGTIERASINTGASFTAFATVPGVTLAMGCGACASVVIGRFLYVFEGSQVERAALNIDGSLGQFQVASEVVLPSSGSPKTAVAKDKVYLLGGALTYMAPITAADSIGAFAPLSVSPDSNSTVAVVGNSMYSMGGGGVFPYFTIDTVEQATINADGTVSSFATVGHLTTSPSFSTSVVVGNFFYVIGGFVFSMAGFSVQNSIERAAINPDGSIGPFTLVPNLHLNTARYTHTSVIIGRYIYILGGFDANGATLASIERAPIGADGSIGPFEQISTSLGTSLGGAAAVMFGNALYVIGVGPTGKNISMTTLQ